MASLSDVYLFTGVEVLVHAIAFYPTMTFILKMTTAVFVGMLEELRK
jgi:hypothetical protein